MTPTPETMGIQNSVLDGTFYFDTTRFDSMISELGINILWRKSHICPCGAITGSPDPLCTNCGGIGRYWDATSVAFVGAISFMIPDDPSVKTNFRSGSFITALPLLTIPQIAGDVWTNAAMYDQFVFSDVTTRFMVNLQNNIVNSNVLPYTYGVSVPATGAVVVYDAATHAISADNNYTVSTVKGVTTVNLTDQVDGTPFSVEYTANQAYVAYGRGGVGHVRPEAGGLRLPKRFQLSPLDIWLRGHSTTG